MAKACKICYGRQIGEAYIGEVRSRIIPSLPTKHLKNIIDIGELIESSVSSILERTADDGKIYATKYYNLDITIAVGYRVRSGWGWWCKRG